MDSRTLHHKAEEYQKNGDYDKAIEAFSRAIELEADLKQKGDLYNYRGICHVESFKYDEAIADYTKSIECDPATISPNYNRATCYKAMDKFDLAIVDLSNAYRLYKKIIVNPEIAKENKVDELVDLVDVCAERVQCYIKTNQFFEAVQDASAVIVASNDQKQIAVAFMERGYCYVKLDQPKKALNDFQSAFENDDTVFNRAGDEIIDYLNNNESNFFEKNVRKTLNLSTRMQLSYNGDVPEHFKDKIHPDKKVMNEPVIFHCGDTTDIKTLEYFKKDKIKCCPSCNKEFTKEDLTDPTPNKYVKELITDFIEHKEKLESKKTKNSTVRFFDEKKAVEEIQKPQEYEETVRAGM